MRFIWYTHPTGFGLWKRFDNDEKERPIYIQQQQAQWITEEVRVSDDFEIEELSGTFLKYLHALRDEIHAFEEGNTDKAQLIAEKRKEHHQNLDFKEKKIAGELKAYFGHDRNTPINEMADLLDYAARESPVESFTEL